MSGFVDFVVGRAEEAKEVAHERNPTHRWQGVSAKFVHEYHLEDLGRILSGNTVEEFRVLASEKTVRVYALSERLVQALAGVMPERAADVGKRWFREWDLPGLQSEESLTMLVSELARLSKVASERGGCVLVRESTA